MLTKQGSCTPPKEICNKHTLDLPPNPGCQSLKWRQKTIVTIASLVRGEPQNIPHFLQFTRDLLTNSSWHIPIRSTMDLQLFPSCRCSTAPFIAWTFTLTCPAIVAHRTGAAQGTLKKSLVEGLTCFPIKGCLVFHRIFCLVSFLRLFHKINPFSSLLALVWLRLSLLLRRHSSFLWSVMLRPLKLAKFHKSW